MENIIFAGMLVAFISYDLYKMIRREMGFYTFFKPLTLMVIYKFILGNLSINLYYITLFYMLANYLYILNRLEKKEEVR